MPELPDITVYVEALQSRLRGQAVRDVRVVSPFFLRSYDPPLEAIVNRPVGDVRRLGKRIVLAMEGDLFVVLHLMVAGRLRWLTGPAMDRPAVPRRLALAVLDFDEAALVITEAGNKRRASLHLVHGREALAAHDRGGLEILESDVAAFADRLHLRNHTLKRALTDPRLFSGVGNAYSDEILHAARLSPITWTSRLRDDEVSRLHEACQTVLDAWTQRLRTECAGRFPGPGDMTAFRKGFAVHGRFGKPCPICATEVQRIRYADHETHYCPRCQTGGRVLADRSLSRLLKGDWPERIEELET